MKKMKLKLLTSQNYKDGWYEWFSIQAKEIPGKVKVSRWNGKWFELGQTGKNDVQGKNEIKKEMWHSRVG